MTSNFLNTKPCQTNNHKDTKKKLRNCEAFFIYKSFAISSTAAIVSFKS